MQASASKELTWYGCRFFTSPHQEQEAYEEQDWDCGKWHRLGDRSGDIVLHRVEGFHDRLCPRPEPIDSPARAK